MFKVSIVSLIFVGISSGVLFEKLNEPETLQIEAPKSKHSKQDEADKRSDRFVLIGHSDQLQIQQPKREQENKARQKKLYQSYQTKDYYSKDHYTNKYNSYLDQIQEEGGNDVGSALHPTQNMTSYYNPRSGIHSNRFGGSNGNGYSYNGNGYSVGGAGSGGSLLGSGFFGGGLLGLHLLDPLILLATLSFVLFLVNSVITLVERLRFPLGNIGHGGALGRMADDPARRLLIDQELIAEVGQYFHQLMLDYENKLKNDTEKAF